MIEAALADEDPELGDLLTASPPAEVVITRIARRVLVASTSLLIFGAVVGNAFVLAAAVLLLEFSLAALLVVAAGQGA